jgi:hypothetical protein
MTSRSAAQKWDVAAYLARVGMRADAFGEAERERGEKKRAAKRDSFDEFDQRSGYEDE